MLASLQKLNKLHYKRVAPLARSQKSKHKFIFFQKSLSGLDNLILVVWGEGWNKNVLGGREERGTSIRHSRLLTLCPREMFIML